MSWAAHNPEAYDEILKSGIVNKLRKELADNGFNFEDDFDFLPAVVEVMFQEPKISAALLSWALREVTDAEADHWATLANYKEEL